MKNVEVIVILIILVLIILSIILFTRRSSGNIQPTFGNECIFDSDCPGSFTCERGVCVPGPFQEPEPECILDEDCPIPNSTCVDGVCVEPTALVCEITTADELYESNSLTALLSIGYAYADTDHQGSGVQSTGKLVTSSGGRRYIVRLNADGTLDTSFASGGEYVITFPPSWTISRDLVDVIVGADDCIYVTIDAIFNTNRLAIFKLSPDGVLDTSFAGGSTFFIPSPTAGHEANPGHATIFSHDKQHIYMAFLNSQGWRIVKMDLNGVEDPTFGTGGYTAALPDNFDEAVIAADENHVYFLEDTLRRYSATDGSHDTSYGGSGDIDLTPISCMDDDSTMNAMKIIDGNAFVAKLDRTCRTVTLVKFLPDGTQDLTFGNVDIFGGAYNVEWGHLTFECDDVGTMILAGSFDDYDGDRSLGFIVMINPDGTPRTEFEGTGIFTVEADIPTGWFNDPEITHFAIGPDKSLYASVSNNDNGDTYVIKFTCN